MYSLHSLSRQEAATVSIPWGWWTGTCADDCAGEAGPSRLGDLPGESAEPRDREKCESSVLTGLRPPADRLFRDPDLDARIRVSDVVTAPAITPERAQQLVESYWSLVPKGEEGLCLDYARRDRSVVRRLADLAEPVLWEVFDDLFIDRLPMLVSFIVKHPGEQSEMVLHRDVAGNDEREFRGHTLWLPLVDVGPELDNGPLAIVPGSAALPSGFAGVDATLLLAPYRRSLERRLRPLSVPAGHAVVYESRLLHASGPNRSAVPRLAIGCMVVRRNQPVVQVIPMGRRHRAVYRVDRDFFIEHHPADVVQHGMPPGYQIIDEFDEEPELPDPVLQSVLGDGTLHRDTVLPVDIAERWAGAAQVSLPSLPSPGWPRQRHDLRVTSAGWPQVGRQLHRTPVSSVSRTGERPLVRRWRRVGAAPAAVTEFVVPLRRLRTRDASLVALDPGARVEFAGTPAGWWQDDVLVLEAPLVRAGIATAAGAVELSPGLRFEMPSAPAVLWNDGPGPVLLLVRTCPRLLAGVLPGHVKYHRDRGGGVEVTGPE